MEKKIIRCESTTTFSSIVGNLTSFATDYFKARFPTGYFKHTFISDSLNSINLEDNDMQKYPLPALSVRPELSLDSTFMEQLPYWYRSYHYIMKGPLRNQYSKVLADPIKGIYLYCIPTRIKINFSFRIKLQTQMNMYDILQYMNNIFESGGYEFVNGIKLQNEVPKTMMINLAKNLGFDLSKVDHKKLFEKYLMENSFNTITNNVNMSTGNESYFYNFKSNILLGYQDYAQGDKNLRNLVVENTNVNFSFSVDCWVPNRYILELPGEYVFDNEVYKEDNNSIKFNTVLDVDYIMPTIENKHLLVKKSFMPDVNVEYDKLDYKGILQKDLTDVIDLLFEKNLFDKKLFEIKVMCGNKLLHEMLYDVDYKHYIVKTKGPMVNTTYTVLAYGDLDELNRFSQMIVDKNTHLLDKL